MATPNDTPAPTKPLMAGCQQEPCSPSLTPETDEAQRLGNVQNQADADQSWPWDAIQRGYDHARKLERERDALLDAIRKTVEEFESISWGWDGDCGTSNIIERLTDHLPDNAEPIRAAQDSE